MGVCTYEEELVGRVTVVCGIKDLASSQNDRTGINETTYAIVAHQGLEPEAKFRVPLNPTGKKSVVSALCAGQGVTRDLLDGITSIARASGDRTVRVDLVDTVRSTSRD